MGMKQFNKWWNKNASSGDDYLPILNAERAWRAALEWWSGKEVIGGNTYTDGNIRFTDVDTRIKLIREELGI